MSTKTRRTSTFRTKHLRYNRYIDFFWRLLGQSLLKRLLRVSHDSAVLKNTRLPYILIANHCSALDPFLYHSLAHKQIHFVISDAQMRIPIINYIATQGGCIAKKKGQIEVTPVKEIMHILHTMKEPVVIFAEGVNTWDGTSQPVVEGTATLIKLAKVPVFYGYAHGAYLTYPRWARGIRRGKINVSLQQILTLSQIRSMTKAEIQNLIDKAFIFNEFDLQEKFPIPFYSSSRAEYIERVLFSCPYCLQVTSIVSHKQYFSCTSCQREWLLDNYGAFHLNTDCVDSFYLHRNKVDANIATWNQWQHTFLDTLLAHKGNNEVIFFDELCTIKLGTRRLSMSYGIGRVSLTSTHLYFMPMNNDGPMCRFLVQDMVGVNIQNNEKLEWTHNKLFYQVGGVNPRVNMYKYMLAIRKLQHH